LITINTDLNKKFTGLNKFIFCLQNDFLEKNDKIITDSEFKKYETLLIFL